MSRIAVSADCHINEPADLWTRGLPRAMRERGPRAATVDGRACMVVEERVIRRFGLARDAAPRDEPPREAPPGGYEPADRVRDLERDGVWGEVLYPSVGFFCTYAIEDPALQVETCRVYNDWLGDLYGGSDRHAAVGMLPDLDAQAGVDELQRLPSLGIRSGLLPMHSDRRPYNDSSWEPLWEAAAGLGIPLSFHVGTGRSQTPHHGPGAAVVNYVVTVGSAAETVTILSGSGVLERHPALRVVMVESGAGWLAWTLEAMDDAYRDHHMFVTPKLRELPSATFRRQGAVTFQRDPVAIANAELTGVGCLLWGSDCPHPEGTFPHSQKSLDEQLAGVSDEVTRRIVCTNTAELYGIRLPDGAV